MYRYNPIKKKKYCLEAINCDSAGKSKTFQNAVHRFRCYPDSTANYLKRSISKKKCPSVFEG